MKIKIINVGNKLNKWESDGIGYYQKQLPKNILNQRYSVENFIPHATYDGRKKGYYFSTGFHGTGYYLDEVTR